MYAQQQLIDKALGVTERWYEEHRNKRGNVNTNIMTGGIAVAELLREQFPLTEASIKSEKNSQVKGLSGSFIKGVLAKYGETRKFTSEGGRTSRGALVEATKLAVLLSEELLPYNPRAEDRALIADALQMFFVEKVRLDYFGKQRIEVDIDMTKPASLIVGDILRAAQARPDQQAGVVAQHLVGAKLELRFPALCVGRDKANTADLQTGRQGDFQLGSTAFHVTMSPLAKLVDRARDNIAEGFRPVMLVPHQKVPFAIGLFESEGLGEHVNVQSIESFVGTNIEEMGQFALADIKRGIAKLIRVYNERIMTCESDQSLQIKEPAWIELLLDTQYAVMDLNLGE